MPSLTHSAATIMLLSLTLATAGANKLQSIPDLTVRDIDGKELSLKALSDSGVVVVDFWATWCVPCAAAVKHIAKLHDDFRDKGLSVVAVSVEGVNGTSKVRQHAKSKKWKFSVVVDRNDQLKQAFGVVDVPTLFVVRKGGAIDYIHSGFVAGDEKKLREHVEQAIKSPQ